MIFFFFFFNDTATTEIYTLSLHDALPIYSIWPLMRKLLPSMTTISAWCSSRSRMAEVKVLSLLNILGHSLNARFEDRKSTRLNSSHSQISYAVFCLKKKKSRAQTPV